MIFGWGQCCYLAFSLGQCFSSATPVFSTNKTDRHDIAEKLLKVPLNTITVTTGTFKP
jgi:hypothetical protein